MFLKDTIAVCDLITSNNLFNWDPSLIISTRLGSITAHQLGCIKINKIRCEKVPLTKSTRSFHSGCIETRTADITPWQNTVGYNAVS